MKDIENYLYVLLASLIIISVLIYRYSSILKKYFKDMTLASEKASTGDYYVKLTNNYSGDLGRLSNNFNSMIEKIRINIEELEDKNINLKAILKSISNGIVAIDNDERILLMNSIARKLFDYDKDDFEGMKYYKVINNKLFLETIKSLTTATDSKEVDLEDNKGNFYKIKVDPIRLEDEENMIIGSIINIEDVTEKIRLEKIRSEFVVNVTHELKTPLTSINGFVETLKNNDDIDKETRDRFLGIIETESNRLRRLIDDILMLSFIEGSKQKTDNITDLVQTFKEVYDVTYGLAQNKKIDYKYHFNKEKILIRANKDHIKQLFLNLVDNAIKYTQEKGIVFVEIIDKDDSITIHIKDNGIGIPQEDIPRIFERFYRVDKARNKKIGGTGLGLAIVKHIVLSLDGNISVNSKLNEGTEFIVQLPK
ncbi:sensor histidine kinase [Alkalithermobacter paradoxus]|uniref:histidine kinase n=1 Tax=Alkalithermobacter paradoxus TaxID=29349 RepID=A0A1V4IA50_9FIRM|nr:alkaline phosphatase synthesis sensor protein PhoR [[Clostridium] thermoalcaliphilum]